MVKRLRHRCGYTLTEMMLVVAILGILATVGPTIMIQVIRFYQLHNAKAEIQRDARVCLDIMNRTLREGLGYTVNIDQVTGQPPASRISFSTFDGRNIVYYQSGHTLYQVSTSTSVLSQNLRFIAFTYPRSDDPTIISVAMTMERASFEGRYKALELSIEKVRVMN